MTQYNPQDNEIPYGYCRCGCGRKTNLAPHSSKQYGWIKGEPIRYIRNHDKKQGNANCEDDFWDNVEIGLPDECWSWKLAVSSPGYGIMTIRGERQGAHRLAWKFANKQEIPDGLLIRHKCDNKLCCNPAHLELGTYADNTADREERGRIHYLRGEESGNAKLTENDIREIRRLFAGGMHRDDIAERYSIHHIYVNAIVRKVTWKHVE